MEICSEELERWKREKIGWRKLEVKQNARNIFFWYILGHCHCCDMIWRWNANSKSCLVILFTRPAASQMDGDGGGMVGRRGRRSYVNEMDFVASPRRSRQHLIFVRCFSVRLCVPQGRSLTHITFADTNGTIAREIHKENCWLLGIINVPLSVKCTWLIGTRICDFIHHFITHHIYIICLP